jgi:hypothetical protein
MHTTIRFSVNVTDAAGNHRVRVYRDGAVIFDTTYPSLFLALSCVSFQAKLMECECLSAGWDVSP